MRGIDGLTGRVPVGAVLTLGRKALPDDVREGFFDSNKPNNRGAVKYAGTPILRERLFLMDPDPIAVSGMKGGARRMHPSFAPFNSDAPNELRSRVAGWLVHATEEEAWHYNMRSYTDPSEKKTPSRRPWCEGDGVRARRISWDADGAETVADVPCPHDKCPFRQPRGRKPPLCKPHGTLLFQLAWETEKARSMPTPLIKWTTQSWHSIRNIIGFFDRIRQAAESLGLEHYSLMGLRFNLTVQPRTDSRGEGRRFPVVRISPTMDPMTHFASELAERRMLLDQQRPVHLLEGSVERSPAVRHVDHEQNRPGLHTDVIDVTEEP